MFFKPNIFYCLFAIIPFFTTSFTNSTFSKTVNVGNML